MTVTVDDLAAHLGGVDVTANSDSLTRALGTAHAQIDRFILTVYKDTAGVVDPATMTADQAHDYDQALLTVGGDIWRRKDTTGGVYAASDGNAYPVPLARDPVTTVRPMLRNAGLIRRGQKVG